MADDSKRTPDVSSIHGKGKRRVKRSYEAASLEESRSKEDYKQQVFDQKTINEDGTVHEEQPMQQLRVLARQRYLTEKEEQQLELLSKELHYLENDVKQYGWDNLTQRERDNITLKRDLMDLVRQRKSLATRGFSLQDDYLNDDGNIDINRKRELLNKRDDYTKNTNANRQQEWEETQLRKALKGPQDTGEDIHVPGSEEYEFVFDDEAGVDFTDETDDVLPEKDAAYENELLTRLEAEQKRVSTIQEMRKLLPVYKYRKDLLDAIRENQILIVVSETGSGKTTQLPQFLFEDGYTKNGKFQIAVTQPRRVAATAVSARVAEEMDVVLGKEVGYSIRFDDKTHPQKTILKYMTDGMLLREFLADPELLKYSCIMIDEAHERTLATDILLGLLKDILLHRKDLKLIISSATMNSTKFSKFFYNCPIFNIPGRRFPVDIHYTLQPEANYLQAAISTIFQIHTKEKVPGDILVFLTGQDEIETAREKIEIIAEKLGSGIKPMIITPIYANLPQEEQEKIFIPTPPGCRKIVLATNIAETSLTIDGIKYVVDPGFVKENSFVPTTGMSQLETVACSRASVDQRAGRAGRVGPGKCYRLFTKWSYYNELELMPKPEIIRANLSNTVLLLLSLGITDLLKFPMLDKPSVSSLSKSLEQLYVLGALNSKGIITRLGRIMCAFPCEPEFAKVLHTSASHHLCAGVLEECLTIVSMLLEATSLFAGQRKATTSNSIAGKVSSDHMLYLRVYEEWANTNYSRLWCQDHKVQYKTLRRVKNIRDQLWRCCERLGFTALNAAATENANGSIVNPESRIAKSFISGFPMNVAQLGTSGYHTTGLKKSGGLNVFIHPSSVVFQQTREEAKKPSRYVLYQQLLLTSKEFIKDCMPVTNESWLQEMVPQVFNSR